MTRGRFAGVIEDFPRLRTWHLRGEDSEALLEAGFTAYYHGGPPRVALELHGEPYGTVGLQLVPFNDAVRPMLICPRCGVRRGVIVLHPSGAGCRGRDCLNLTWRTTRQTTQERRGLRREYLDGLLLDEDGMPRRPHRMRREVFEALMDEMCWLESVC